MSNSTNDSGEREQGGFEFGGRLSPTPHKQSPGELISEMFGTNGLAVQGEDYCAYVVSWSWAPDLGRCLVIQENDMGHVHIRLRDDVSNDDALRHAQALLAAVAALRTPDDDDTEQTTL
jgi:hypothetical protein